MTPPTAAAPSTCSPTLLAAWQRVDQAIAAAPGPLATATGAAIRDIAAGATEDLDATVTLLLLALDEPTAVALVHAGYVDADAALRAADLMPATSGPLGDPLGWDRFDLAVWGPDRVPLVPVPGRGYLPATVAHQLGALRPDEVPTSAMQQPTSRAYTGGPVDAALTAALRPSAATALLGAARRATSDVAGPDAGALDVALRGVVARAVDEARAREIPSTDEDGWCDDELTGPAVWPSRQVITDAVRTALPETGFSPPLWALCDPVWAWDAALRQLLAAPFDDPIWARAGAELRRR